MTCPTREKFILDATCGRRMMWRNKRHPNTVYLDERKEVNPDIIGDFRDLSQFKDECFNLIVFDPPHEIRNKPSNPKASFIRDFGFLKPETWHSDIKKGFEECWRVLKPMGVLIFKWNTLRKQLCEIEPLFPTKPLFQQITKGNKTGRKDDTQTCWYCFMKIPEESK